MTIIINAAPMIDPRTATRIFTGKAGATPALIVPLLVAVELGEVVDEGVDNVVDDTVDEAVEATDVDVLT